MFPPQRTPLISLFYDEISYNMTQRSSCRVPNVGSALTFFIFSIVLVTVASPVFAGITFRAASSAAQSSSTVGTTITYVAAGTESKGTGGNRAPTIPTGIVANDLLLCSIASRDNVTPTMSGWTQRYSVTNGSTLRSTLFWKIAGASEATPTITYSGSASVVSRCIAFRGVDATSPFDADHAAGAVDTESSDDKFTTGTVTNTTAGVMMVIAGAANDKADSDNGISTDGGLSTWADPGIFSIYDSANDVSIGFTYAGRTASGSSFGPVSLDTDRNAATVAVILALKPAVAISNALTITKPAGTVAGDVMMASIVTTPYTIGFTMPTGWTLIRNTVHSSSGGNSHIASYYRVAGSSEPASYAWTFDSNHAGASGGIATFSGVDTASPIVISAEQKENGNSTTQTAPSVIASAGDMLVTAHSFKSSRSWTPPSEMTEMVDQYSATSQGSSGVALEMNHLLIGVSGATGTKAATASGSGDEGASQSILLKPLIVPTCVTKSPIACASATGIGAFSWINPGNAVGSNNSYATITNMDDGDITNYLKCTDYGFAIPSGSTIDLISIGAERYGESADFRDYSVRIVKADTIQTTANAAKTGTDYPSSDPGTIDWHDGTSTYWGSTWTYADINSTTFGAAFSAVATRNSRDVFVDHLPINVCYSAVAASVDHVEVVHDGSALTCLPEEVTVRLCKTATSCNGVAANEDTASSISITLATPAGSSWYTSAGSAITFPQSVTSGTKFYLSKTTLPSPNPLRFSGTSVGTANTTVQCYLSGAATGGTPDVTTACDSSFAEAGFLLTIANQTACAESTAVSIQAVQTSPGTGICAPLPSFVSSTRSVTLTPTYDSLRASGTYSSISFPKSLQVGTSAGALASAPSSVSLTFNSSATASIFLRYDDAGQITLQADTAASSFSAALTGSKQFVVAPAKFALSADDNGSTPVTLNSSSTTAGSTPRWPAGATFYTQAQAQCSDGNITASYAPSNASLQVNTYLPTVANGGTAGALSVGTSSITTSATNVSSQFSAGTLRATSIYTEAGILTLQIADPNYFGSTIPAATATVGRFVPAYFDTSFVYPAGCDNFMYATASELTSKPVTTKVTAKNALGSTTANYSYLAGSGLARDVTLSNAGVTTRLINSTVATSAFGATTVGEGSTTNLIYSFASLPAAPETFVLRAADGDGVTSDVATTTYVSHVPEPTTSVRNGRLRLLNAYGSVSPLKMSVETQYWNGQFWLKNTDDSCTTTTGALPQITFPAIADWTLTPDAIVSGAMSLGGLKIEKAAAGNTTITATVPDWLKPDSSAQATIGIYGTKESRKAVHIRELY